MSETVNANATSSKSLFGGGDLFGKVVKWVTWGFIILTVIDLVVGLTGFGGDKIYSLKAFNVGGATDYVMFSLMGVVILFGVVGGMTQCVKGGFDWTLFKQFMPPMLIIFVIEIFASVFVEGIEVWGSLMFLMLILAGIAVLNFFMARHMKAAKDEGTFFTTAAFGAGREGKLAVNKAVGRTTEGLEENIDLLMSKMLVDIHLGVTIGGKKKEDTKVTNVTCNIVTSEGGDAKSEAATPESTSAKDKIVNVPISTQPRSIYTAQIQPAIKAMKEFTAHEKNWERDALRLDALKTWPELARAASTYFGTWAVLFKWPVFKMQACGARYNVEFKQSITHKQTLSNGTTRNISIAAGKQFAHTYKMWDNQKNAMIALRGLMIQIRELAEAMKKISNKKDKTQKIKMVNPGTGNDKIMDSGNIALGEAVSKGAKLGVDEFGDNLQESLKNGIDRINEYIVEMDTSPVDFKDVPTDEHFTKYWLKNLDYTYWTEICPQRNEVAVSGYTPYNVSTFKEGNTVHYIYKELDVLSAKGL